MWTQSVSDAVIKPFLAKNRKKYAKICENTLANPRGNSIIGAVPERTGQKRRNGNPTGRDGNSAKLPGRLKESEMCFVTAQESFLEVKFTENRTKTLEKQ